VFVGGPSGTCRCDLREQPQGVVGAEAVKLGQVDARQVVEDVRTSKAGFRVAGLWRDRAGGKRGGRRDDSAVSVCQLGLNREIAGGKLLFGDRSKSSSSAGKRDMFGAIVAGQRPDDLASVA